MDEQQKEQIFEEIEQAEDERYSPEELQEATVEVQHLTPEAYMDMKRFIETAAEQGNNPEANAVAATTLYGQQGGYIYLSARSSDIARAISQLIFGVQYASAYGLKPGGEKGASAYRSAPVQAQPAPAPAPAPATAATSTPMPAPTPVLVPDQMQQSGGADTDSIQVIEVSTVRHQVSPTGIHFFNVKGGMWKKHGFPAWVEVAEEAGVDINAYQVGLEYQPPAEMKYAWVDTQKKKVIKFAPQQ